MESGKTGWWEVDGGRRKVKKKERGMSPTLNVYTSE